MPIQRGAGPSLPPASRVIVQAPTLPPIITARAPAPTRQQIAYVPPARPVFVPPKPAPASTRTGYNPRGVAIAPAPRPTVNDLHAAAVAAAPFHDAGARGDYAQAAVDAYKQTPQYKQAVLDVFQHQPPYQRQAIVSGALHNTVSPEAKMILDYVKRTGGGPTGGANLVPAALYGSVVRASMPPVTGVEKFLQAGVKDVANLAPGTLEGLWNVGVPAAKSLYYGATLNFPKQRAEAKKVEQAVLGGPIQTLEHPVSSFEQHPVNTLLMFMGAKALLGKGVGAAGRAAGADWASTARTPLSLGTVSGEPTAAPLVEERSYSKDIFNKGVQVAREKAIAARGQNPNIARPAPRWMPEAVQGGLNIGQAAKLRRVGNEMASTQQVLSRAERNRVNEQIAAARPQDKAAEPIVTHFLQSVARNPENAVTDLTSESQRLQAARTHTRSQHNQWNKQQVRDIETALKTPSVAHTMPDGSTIMLPRAVSQAIAAADKLRPILHDQDTVLGAHGILTPEEIVAKYFPYAQKHMGAVYDFEKGWLKNAQHPEGIPIQAIQDHLAGLRDVANPDFVRATRVHENAQRIHGIRQAEHNQAAAEYRAAVENHRNASAIDQGRPTPDEITKLSLLRMLRNRPGTPGEGAAAQAAMDRIEGKIRGRGGGADPAVLRAAEQRLASANAQRQATRANLNNATESAYRAHQDLASMPETVTRQVETPVPEPAYVGHYNDKNTPSQYFKRYNESRGTLSQGKRTGEAFRLGGYDHTYEGLNGQMAVRAQMVAKAGIHDRLVQRSFLKPKQQVEAEVRQAWAKARDAMQGKGPAARARILRATEKQVAELRTGMYTHAEAERAIFAQPRDELGNLFPSELELQPIRAAPAKSIDQVQGLQNPMQLDDVSSIELNAVRRAIAEAKDSSNQARNIVLAPKVLTDQLKEQFAPAGRSERTAGRLTQQFRNTVLPYSTHWMLQIGTEAALRSLLAGIVNPRDVALGRALEGRLGQTEPGRAAAAEATGATFYGQRGTMGIYHSPNRLVRFLQDTRGTSDIINAHKWWVDRIGRMMYGFEHTARQAGLGKLARDHAAEIRQFGGQWRNAVKTQGEIVDAVAHGLETNPALVAKFGRQIDALFGQYGKYSPMTRTIIQSYAPFLPWYLTAAKYVFWQLPAHHPIASGLLASLRSTVDKDVKDGKKLPLDPFAAQAFGTLSPFGIFTPQSQSFANIAREAVQKPASLLLPGLSGAALAALGKDPFWGTLKGAGGKAVPAGSLSAFGQSANSLAEAMIPLLTRARYAAEGGRPSYGTSTLFSPQVKPGGGPGNLSQILNREANPIYSLQRALKAKPRVVTTSGGGGGGGGSKTGWGGTGRGGGAGGWGGTGGGAGSGGGWGR